MHPLPLGPKKTVSVTLEPALLQQARDAGINLSETLSDALKCQIRAHQVEIWQRENQQALQELNRIADEYGVFSDDHRTF